MTKMMLEGKKLTRRRAVLVLQRSKAAEVAGQTSQFVGFVVGTCYRGKWRGTRRSPGTPSPALEGTRGDRDRIQVMPGSASFFQAELHGRFGKAPSADARQLAVF